MLPRFDAKGQLPPGIHSVGWSEFKAAFGYNEKRQELIKGMYLALLNLKRAGCLTVYIDGSFVTQKPDPGDYDGCWDKDNVDEILLDPILLDTSGDTYHQKRKYMGEMFPIRHGVDDGMLWYFQLDREDDDKGIVMICLGDLDD